MEIYVVQEGDTLESIAQSHGVTIDKLILDNGLSTVSNLAIGQTLVITYPQIVHTVQAEETLEQIAALYQVTTLQLLRNNPFLVNRDVIPQEVLVISYNTKDSIAANGFCYSYISKNTLIRTLPNLTFLSIFNYTITEDGNIITYQDDSDVIRTAKEYKVIPLLLLTTLTPRGEQNIDLDYQILLDEQIQNRNMEQFLQIINEKGYLGINLVFYNLNKANQELYVNFVKRIWERIHTQNLYFYITVNYEVDEEETIVAIDYDAFREYISGFIFMRFVWGTNYSPPGPVSDITYIRNLVEYVSTTIPTNKINIGNPVIGYDWNLTSNLPGAYSLAISSVLGIAYETNSAIQFDEHSQTPFFYYYEYSQSVQDQHVIWFIDARSLEALMLLMKEYNLYGNGVWNIMIYNAQLWTIINANYEVLKLID